MIRGKLIQRPVLMLMALAIALASLWSGPDGVIAAKPAPPPPPSPPPTGTIYYTGPGGFWAMNPDGSQKTLINLALPLVHPDVIGTPTAPGHGIPCDRVYGSDPKHDRWYLCNAPTARYDRIIVPDGREITNPDRLYHYDIFAFRTDPGNRSQLQVVQITDFFGEAWTEAGIGTSWSNDSNESMSASYIDSATLEVGPCFVVEEDEVGDPVYIIDFRLDPSKWNPVALDVIHVPLTAGEVQTAWDLQVDLDLSLYADAEMRPFFTAAAAVSPTRTEYVAAENNRIVIHQMSDGALVRTVWNGSQGVQPTMPSEPTWSRDGLTIIFHNGGANYSSNGGVWSVPAAGGATPTQLVANSVTKGWVFTKYTNSGCSPDSAHLCLRYSQHDDRNYSGTLVTDLLRIPLTGGSKTNMTGDIGGGLIGYRWVSNTTAP